MKDKKTIMIIGDQPLLYSGVGNQIMLICQALLKTERYKIVCLGGAVKHPQYQPIMTEEYGEDWIIYPVDGYGNPDVLRSVVRTHRPDVLLMMTDPRFYYWLWQIDNEIRSVLPIIYYHVWDNYPAPKFNERWYHSCDVIATISKLTDDIVRIASPEVERHHIPHSIDTEVFTPLSKEVVAKHRKEALGENFDKMIFFWNNRNARRKQPGTLIFWFAEFLEEIGKDRACLLMHTDPRDQVGQNLEGILYHLGLTNGEVLLSPNKMSPQELAVLYNLADCTINISDAEGFGLATLESLACGVPIIVNMTGGLQEQVTDGENWFGVGIEPRAKAIIGGQDIPYIYEDRLVKEDFLQAMRDFYALTDDERTKLGAAGREHVLTSYGYETFNQQWVGLMDTTIEKHGSWDTRTGYTSWKLESF